MILFVVTVTFTNRSPEAHSKQHLLMHLAFPSLAVFPTFRGMLASSLLEQILLYYTTWSNHMERQQ